MTNDSDDARATQTTTTQAASGAEGFSFQQPQRNRMHDALRRLGEAAIKSQKITDHEAANAAQRQCLAEIEALVREALAGTEPAGWSWDEVGTRLRGCSIHSIAGGEPERYLIKIGCPDIQTMQAVRDGMVHLREGTTAPQPAGAERVDLSRRLSATEKLKLRESLEDWLVQNAGIGTWAASTAAKSLLRDDSPLVPASLPAALGRGEGKAGATAKGDDQP